MEIQWAKPLGAVVIAAGVALPFSVLAQSSATPDGAAMQWLSFIDGSDYARGWARAGSPFKAKLTPQVLQSKIAPVREPLGAIMQRTLSKKALSSTAAGLPDGKYAAVHFRSRFAKQGMADETVWLALENNGWTVIGYLIGSDNRKTAGQQPTMAMYVTPPGKVCTHEELVRARIARMNRYTGGPICANGP